VGKSFLRLLVTVKTFSPTDDRGKDRAVVEERILCVTAPTDDRGKDIVMVEEQILRVTVARAFGVVLRRLRFVARYVLDPSLRRLNCLAPISWYISDTFSLHQSVVLLASSLTIMIPILIDNLGNNSARSLYCVSSYFICYTELAAVKLQRSPDCIRRVDINKMVR
jgi:hypothetical protein